MNAFKKLTINAVLLMVIAAIVEMMFHELGHYFCAGYFHASALNLHHNYVNFDENSLSILQRIWVATAGPLTSLFIGILFQFIVSIQKSRNYLFLFNAYFSAHGYIGFFGYLMIAPIAVQGDTGFIMHQLHFTIYVTVVIAIVALFILRVLIILLTRYILEFSTESIYMNSKSRKQFVVSTIILPVYIGLILIILLNLPVPIWISLMAPFSIFSFFFAYGHAMKKNFSNMEFNKNEAALFSIQPFIIIAFIALVIVNRLLV